MGVTATLDGDAYVMNGKKYWPCNVGGWDNKGANLNLVVCRTDSSRGGTEGLSAIIVERGTPGITYDNISTLGQRTAPNFEITFDNARVPADNMIEGAKGNGDLLINRNFAWSGPVAGIGAVAVARAAYEDALEWAKTYTAGGPKLIIHYQYPGYVLGDVAAKIEAARYFCWKTAHYLDQHDYHGEMLGAMCKIHCTEMLFDCVYKCMQVVGVNSVDRKHQYDRYLREAAVLPLYDAGNFGMQRRRVHGVMADPSFNPRAVMDDEAIEFTKAMEGIDTIPARPRTIARRFRPDARLSLRAAGQGMSAGPPVAAAPRRRLVPFPRCRSGAVEVELPAEATAWPGRRRVRVASASRRSARSRRSRASTMPGTFDRASSGPG